MWQQEWRRKINFKSRIRADEITWRGAKKEFKNSIKRFLRSNGLERDHNKYCYVVVHADHWSVSHIVQKSLIQNTIIKLFFLPMTYSKCYYHELCIANIWHIRHGVEHRCIRNYIGRRSNFRWIGFDTTGWLFRSENNAVHITFWLGVGSVHVHSVLIFPSKWIRRFQLPLAANPVLITHHFHFKCWCRGSGQYMYSWEFSTKG